MVAKHWTLILVDSKNAPEKSGAHLLSGILGGARLEYLDQKSKCVRRFSELSRLEWELSWPGFSGWKELLRWMSLRMRLLPQ